MRWSCLQFNVSLLPESYRRQPAETRWKPLSPAPLHGQGVTLKTILNPDHTQRTRNQCDFPVLPWFSPVWRFHLVVEWVSTIHGCIHSWRFYTHNYDTVYQVQKSNNYVMILWNMISIHVVPDRQQYIGLRQAHMLYRIDNSIDRHTPSSSSQT